MNIYSKETYGLEKKEIDYKKLYEETKAKLDAIEWEKTKKEIDNRLELTYQLFNDYRKEEIRKNITEGNYFHALERLDVRTVDSVIKEFGWETVTKALDETLTEVLAEEAKEAEEPK